MADLEEIPVDRDVDDEEAADEDEGEERQDVIRRHRRDPIPAPQTGANELRFVLVRSTGRPRKVCDTNDEIIKQHRRKLDAKLQKRQRPTTGMMAFVKRRRVEDID